MRKRERMGIVPPFGSNLEDNWSGAAAPRSSFPRISLHNSFRPAFCPLVNWKGSRATVSALKAPWLFNRKVRIGNSRRRCAMGAAIPRNPRTNRLPLLPSCRARSASRFLIFTSTFPHLLLPGGLRTALLGRIQVTRFWIFKPARMSGSASLALDQMSILVCVSLNLPPDRAFVSQPIPAAWSLINIQRMSGAFRGT